MISTLPVWTRAERRAASRRCRSGTSRRSSFLAQDQLRISWLGPLPGHRGAGARSRPARALDVAAHADSRALSGFMFNQSAMDPSCSPDGTHLHVDGRDHPGREGPGPRLAAATRWSSSRTTSRRCGRGSRSRSGGAGTSCSSRRFGVIQMPGLVGHVPAALARARTSRACSSPARPSASAASASTARRGPPLTVRRGLPRRRASRPSATGGGTDGTACELGVPGPDHAAGRRGGEVRAAQRGRRLRRGLVAGPPDGLAPRLDVDAGPHPARERASRTRTPTSTR